ncbi:GTP pyrophosphokinase [Lysinibacillus piscis]|uniref:RelA/SpoT domain-containing protein n=1 Tax=Lysinibacillus piscis TaxID=2518931 RepID=A0ABQ5NK62_9BACI|nr:hypothetical protein [Lysinibacillus sp. KH24]GLC88751.1 hypothetical protein LYSBPC_18780 [Lysinibacillus sp. KH24]
MTSTTIKVGSNFNIEAVEKTFSQLFHVYKQLEEEGKHTLKLALNQENIKIHTILSRVKEKDSFLKKIEEKQTTNPFEDITDIVGLRVVCLFLSDIEKITKVINNNFEIILEDNKITDPSNFNMFGYMSAHYIVKIKQHFKGSRYDSIKNIAFEIQVRTISMDAWANISHFLEYKSDNDIPPELKRDFNALSGLFYVADTHFEMFYKERQENTISISEDIEGIVKKSNNHEDIALNLDSLTLYLTNKFSNRPHANSKIVSHFVSELLKSGYTTIQTLDMLIEKGFEASLKFEVDKFGKPHYTDVGFTRLILTIADNNYRTIINPHVEDSELTPYQMLINK